MWGSKLYLFPVAVFILIPFTFIISYIVAVVNNHVEAGFPYISDTGAHPPESCIFGQLLNICAVLAGITVYIRFRNVQECMRRHPKPFCCHGCGNLNKVGLVFGLTAALGASLVANFQETNVIVVHLIGAFMTFGVGAIYCWVHTYISYKLCVQSLRIAHIRLVACLAISVFFIVLFVSTPVALSMYDGNNTRMWTPDEGGYAEHVTSTASEWAMAIAMMFYFLTFVKEFRQFGLRCPTYYQHMQREIIPNNTMEKKTDGDKNSLGGDIGHVDQTFSKYRLSNGSVDQQNGTVADHVQSNGSVDQSNGSMSHIVPL